MFRNCGLLAEFSRNSTKGRKRSTITGQARSRIPLITSGARSIALAGEKNHIFVMILKKERPGAWRRNKLAPCRTKNKIQGASTSEIRPWKREGLINEGPIKKV